MTSPLQDQVRAALATVNDPEIKRPITDLNMVESVAFQRGDRCQSRLYVFFQSG